LTGHVDFIANGRRTMNIELIGMIIVFVVIAIVVIKAK
jgi:hypothetical protein